MFGLVKTVSGKQHQRQQPNFLQNDKGCDMFSEYFTNKTAKLVLNMQCQSESLRHHFQEMPLFTHSLSYSTETNDHDIENIIRRTDKTCQLDPLPDNILRKCIPSLAPVITGITNVVIQQANMPAQPKHAVVRPLLKKVTLDKDALCNYRPVSNLPQLSKVIEKVILQRLTRHIEDESMFDSYQSAYRANHSTETALLFVVNQIKMAFDSRKGTVLVFIDFSSAFDTIDHAILLSRLRLRYGLEGKAVDLIASYLEGRTQRVVIGEQSSSPSMLMSGVPQGSVLGPLLFSLYVQPIGDIIRAHGLFYHQYADDLQLYCHFALNRQALAEAVNQIEKCVDELKDWMTANLLSMNDSKTQYLPIVPKSAARLLDGINVIRIGDNTVTAATTVRNLGVHFDLHLDMNSQTSHVISACSYHLRNINHISRYLPTTTKERVINALITSRLDYCNSVLYNTSANNISRLQRIHNAAARLILCRPRTDRATPLLHKLHWLPVARRIQYKILLLTYKITHRHSPVYLRDLLSAYEPTRCLRSSTSNDLVVARTRGKAGDAAFAVAAPRLWNALPHALHIPKIIYIYTVYILYTIIHIYVMIF